MLGMLAKTNKIWSWHDVKDTIRLLECQKIKCNKHHMESNKRYKKAPCMLNTLKKKASQA
jgi:hypothetical protein